MRGFWRRRATLIMLVGGAVLGLLLGLAISWWWPVGRNGSTPCDLRADFQADYVLQVAERYAATGDLAWARDELGVAHWREGQLAETLERLAQERGGQEAVHLRTLAQALETTSEAAETVPTGSLPSGRRPAVMAYVTVLLGVMLAEVIFAPVERLRGLQLALRRLIASLATLLFIAYLTLFGLIMAERGREGLPAEPLSAAGEALLRTVTYVTEHPMVYYWHRYEYPVFDLVATTFGHSAGLLLMSLGLAVVVGVPLGIAVALARRKGGASLILLFSTLGISTPSFLLAMFCWVVNIQIHRRFGVPALPPTGFGWDLHLVMPALVLAARPLAQIAQVTYVSLSEVLNEDYIRTARAKGLPWRAVRNRHAMRNIMIPVLTTLGTSLRFSLASLPVVEYFFIWPGVGLMLLEAIELGETPLVTDLIVSLGLLFLLINLALELIYPLLDPRLKNKGQEEERRERQSWREGLRGLADDVIEWLKDLRHTLPGARREEPKLRPLPVGAGNPNHEGNNEPGAAQRSRWVLRSALTNPALLVGALLVMGLIGLALFGQWLTEANPYEIHGITIINGEIGAPPFAPSTVFPWGTDHIGRDVQALVLAGARQTLILALLGMLARVLVGTMLGMLAGWWQDSWLDRLVTGAVGVWAAFPVTLFAMILIQALGIQQGVWVFVLALCVVGWGEVAQFVRGQVISIRPRLYIEAARAVGARTGQILTRHVLPNLLVALLVLAVLEMGGVLMLLSELGFLNVFLGGGYRVEIGEYGAMVPVIAYFSDVPEWGALLANIRDWWRSYPWMAWYPGIGFFLAIVTFNVWGEGLRRFLVEGRINLSRLFNRYTAAAAGVAALVLVLVLRSMTPLGVYRAQAKQFDAERALGDIRALASPEFQGREAGRPGAELAATYIAGRMKQIGLAPGGEGDSYMLSVERSTYHLVEPSHLEILDDRGSVAEALTYYRDFVARAGPGLVYGESEGAIVGLVNGPLPDTLSGGDPYGLSNYEVWDKVILVREAEMGRVNFEAAVGGLVISDDPLTFQRRNLYSLSYDSLPPVMYITPEVADRLLSTAGSSLADLDSLAADLSPGEIALTDPGVAVHLETVLEGDFDSIWGTLSEVEFGMHSTIVGVIPGSGAKVEAAPGMPLSSQAIIVSAYYDGVGIGVDGELYPGANDNASGVATMLEIARILMEDPAHPPKRTVVFVAWPDGQRYEGLSVTNAMNGRASTRALNVEAVIELSGVGAGVGKEIALEQGSSYRLVQLFQDAAGRVGASVTTRGRGPHYGMPVGPGFGGRSALTAYVSWDGSDRTAHTVEDTFEAIDPDKLEQVGQTTLLALTVLSRELEY
jgi:peptide/nickel transport system permease protein